MSKMREKTYILTGDHQKYLSRITKTLYYSKLPRTETLSLPVTELAAELFSETQKGKTLNRLHYDEAAKISRNACVSPCSLVLALLYLEKLKVCNPEYLLKTSPSDLFLVSLMVSCKFLTDEDDVFLDEWANSGGITIRQLLCMEKEFLKAINWEIYITNINFWQKLNEIEMAIAQKQGQTRGFYTYTELQNLLDSIELYNLVHCLFAVSIILAASYTAGLLTMAGSMFIVSHIPGNYIETKDNNNVFIPATTHLINSAYENNTIHLESLESHCPKKSYSDNKTILNVLNTSLFLTSLNFDNKTKCAGCKRDSEQPKWKWWLDPLMNWLAKSSEIADELQVPITNSFVYYCLETSNANSKYLDLEDQIHKATKTRIQDQLEKSWHSEWTDTLKIELFNIR